LSTTLEAAPREAPTDNYSRGTGEPAMRGRNIICFAKDWSEDPTSCNHVMRELSRHNKVLWLNSISTRTPNLTSGRDLGKIWRKITAFLQGPKAVTDSLSVYTPLVLPFHKNRLAIALNRWILRATVAMLRRRLGMGSFQLWTFVPTSSDYVGTLGEELLVYYCTDNWSGFSTVDGPHMTAMVESLATRADVVFATSRPLVEQLRPYNPETHLAAHGVDYAAFARATDDDTTVPADLAALPGPVLGFYGLIEDWLDQDLLLYLAARHPEWSIALVGRVCVDVSRLQSVPNIHFLGRKPHSELPNYCKGFAVGLIPHKVNELTIHMNPIKLREYMSAGLPVVSTALPEIRHYPQHCTVTETYEVFERAVEEILVSDTSSRRRARSESMRSETWDRKVAELGGTVQRAGVAKARRESGIEKAPRKASARVL
jgi:glycosyltransferase involved in cell wall biosynthesis